MLVWSLCVKRSLSFWVFANVLLHFYLSFMVVIIIIIITRIMIITMLFYSFLPAMAETLWAWSFIVTPPPDSSHPPTREINTDTNWNTVSCDEKRLMGEASRNKNQKQQKRHVVTAATDRSRSKPRQTNKHFSLSIIQSGAPNRFWFLKIVSGRQKSSWRRVLSSVIKERNKKKLTLTVSVLGVWSELGRQTLVYW